MRIFLALVFAGLSSSCPNVLGYTLKSEIVDVDEHMTGERKEGAYFAVRAFVGKVGFGTGPLLVGLLLQLTGFDPESPMSRDGIFAMRLLIGPVPALGALLGALVLRFVTLDEAEHARIRAALQRFATTHSQALRNSGAPGPRSGTEPPRCVRVQSGWL